jgi:hypothetical protein
MAAERGRLRTASTLHTSSRKLWLTLAWIAIGARARMVRMGQTILLTLGRLPKGLELARGLHAAGHRVLVADPFGWHLSKPSRAVARSIQVPAPALAQDAYLDALAAIARDEAVDLIIPVSEEVMHVSLLTGLLPAQTQLFCPPHDQLLTLHDKYAFAREAKRAGLTAPETFLGDDQRAPELATRSGTVAKARFGCSGAGLHFLRAGEALAPQLRTSDWVIQQQIKGREVGTLSFCRDGEVLAHVVYRGLILSGTVAVAFERIEVSAVDDWVREFVGATGYSGFIAFDFILDEAGAPWPLECNPRLTSGVHFMDPADLATVVTGGALGHAVRIKPQTRFQEGHTALTMAYAQIFKPQRFGSMLKTIASARDVLWSSKDPWVFPLMTPMSWPILKQVLLQGRSFGEAATLDIEWLPGSDTLLEAQTPSREPRAKALETAAP